MSEKDLFAEGLERCDFSGLLSFYFSLFSSAQTDLAGGLDVCYTRG